MNRREFLYTGLVGGVGLSMGDILRAQSTSKIQAKAQSVIHIYLPGGAASHETWDPHPNAPSEYRGPLGSIATSIPGVKFSEHLKHTAKIADQLTIVRSMTHGEAAHERGTTSMFTGYRPSPALEYPSMGTIVNQQLGDKSALPSYVCIPQKIASNGNDPAGTGFLSQAYGPFSLGSDPASDNFKVRDLNLPAGVDDTRFERRRSILESVDNHFKYLESSDALVAMDSFYQKAYDMLSSELARKAFLLTEETQSTRSNYGASAAGQRLLLARRLVERGVRYVSVTYGGWDMHNNIASGIAKQLPAFDQAYAALITDLKQRGMLDSTLVLVSSEFGRTPKINQNAGRDHWPRVFSVVFAGGGFKQGYVHGSSDATGSDVETDPFSPQDMAATLYHQMGIDPFSYIDAPGGRPVMLTKDGRVVKDLLA